MIWARLPLNGPTVGVNIASNTLACISARMGLLPPLHQRFQDQIDTASPMGLAMFTIIGAMAELESSLISERVTPLAWSGQGKGPAHRTSTNASARHRRNRGSRRLNRSQHPPNSREDSPQSVPGQGRRDRKARPIHPIRLMTTFYTYLQPTPSKTDYQNNATPRCFGTPPKIIERGIKSKNIKCYSF